MSTTEQFAQFLTYAALDPVEGYSTRDFQIAMEALPQEGLNLAARALLHALEGSGEQREDYWKNRIKPFWQQIWPQVPKSCLRQHRRILGLSGYCSTR